MQTCRYLPADMPYTTSVDSNCAASCCCLQFAHWEAVRAAGLSGEAHMVPHLNQLQGDIAIDAIPDVATQLPSIPGEGPESMAARLVGGAQSVHEALLP